MGVPVDLSEVPLHIAVLCSAAHAVFWQVALFLSIVMFSSMPESCSDTWVCTPMEQLLVLRNFQGLSFEIRSRARCNYIVCLIAGNANMGDDPETCTFRCRAPFAAQVLLILHYCNNVLVLCVLHREGPHLPDTCWNGPKRFDADSSARQTSVEDCATLPRRVNAHPAVLRASPTVISAVCRQRSTFPAIVNKPSKTLSSAAIRTDYG